MNSVRADSVKREQNGISDVITILNLQDDIGAAEEVDAANPCSRKNLKKKADCLMQEKHCPIYVERISDRDTAAACYTASNF